MTSEPPQHQHASDDPPAQSRVSSDQPCLRVADLAGWRDWLADNHARASVIWLVFDRSGSTRRPCLSYPDALDEALCWGWIDSIVRRLDEDSYLRKFTARTNTGNWSAANIARLRRLLAQGRVHESGLAVIGPEAMARLRGLADPRSSAPVPALPQELIEALDGDPAARSFFATLAPSYRRTYVRWVASAKQAQTRERRAQEAARLLANGVKALLK